MNKKAKALLNLAFIIVIILAAGLLYNNLRDKVEPNTLMPPSNSFESNEADSTDGGTESKDNKELIAAKDFAVYDSGGKETRLSDYIGIPIVLNFWASWCPPCKEEMPHFNEVSEEFTKEEVIFLMLDLVDGQRETVEKGKKYIEENKFTFTVLFDTKQEAATTYAIRSIPTTFFIDKEGYIVTGEVGSIDENTLRKNIAMILND